MKTIFSILFILISVNIYSNPVDSSRAKTIAINYYHSLTNNKTTIKKIECSTYKGQNTYYTFVFQNNDWIVVAADDASEPILAYSTEGSYSEEKPPAYINWMHGYDLEINYLQENKISNRKTINQWNNIKNNNINFNRSSSVSPLLSTKWGQAFTNDDLTDTIPAYNFYSPVNSVCPTGHCEAGCVAVAMAQILKRWNSPNCPQFDWNNMPDELNFNNSNFDIQRNAIAFLIAQCGLKTNMNYCEVDCFSGTNFSNTLYSFMDDFGFLNAELIFGANYSSQSDWEQTLKTELENGRPIFYMGFSGSIGHAYVCDGFFTTLVFSKKFHFNWGWNGDQNAYFSLNDINLPYHEDILAIINLYPTVECNTSLTILPSDKILNPVKYFNPVAGNIYTSPYSSNPIIIENNESVHYRAYNEIVIENFTTEIGADFIAEIVPCPIICDFDDLNKSFLSNQFYINDTLIKDQNLHKNQDVKIYPNPTDGKFSFEITNFDVSKVSVKIFNVFGKEILNEKTTENNGILDLTPFSSGIYFVEIHYNNKTFKDKIIKIR